MLQVLFILFLLSFLFLFFPSSYFSFFVSLFHSLFPSYLQSKKTSGRRERTVVAKHMETILLWSVKKNAPCSSTLLFVWRMTMLEDWIQNKKGKEKRNALGPVSNGQIKELRKPKAGPTHRRCLEILSAMEKYRNRIENSGNIEIILIFAGLR